MTDLPDDVRIAAVNALYDARDSGKVMDDAAAAVATAVVPLVLRYYAGRLDALPPTYKIPGEHETWTPYREGYDDGRDNAATWLGRWAAGDSDA